MGDMIRIIFRDERAATAIEYALLAALVALGIIFALQNLGTALQNIIDFVSSTVNTVLDGD